MPRGPYQKTGEATKRRVLGAYENGGDPIAVGLANGMKRRTICDLIKKGNPVNKPRGGAKHVKINDDVKAFLQGLLGETPDCTLVEMKEKVRERFGITVTAQAIGIVLDGMFYSVKKLRPEPQTMNSDVNKEKRYEYCQSVMQLSGEGCRVIWIDESNINIHCRRSNGRARQGQRCVAKATTSKGANLHVIGAISAMAVITYKTKRGAFKGPDFETWMQELVDNIPPLDTKVVIVCDNAPVHSRAEQALTNAMQGRYGANAPFEFQVLRLAPYSPMLNPIEHMWNSMKSNVKGQLRQRRQEILDGPQVQMTLANHRLGILEQCVGIAMTYCTNNPQLLYTYSQHVNGHIARGLQHEDMLLG